jgi:curved DNA-binding protein
MEYKDYYKVLGVSRSADEKEIKAAYRRLARKYHPDMNPGNKQAEARFKELNEANEVLGDPEKRRRYDTLGANWDAYRSQGSPRGWPGGSRVRVNMPGFGAQDLGGFSDFFKTFFGGGWGGSGGGDAGGGFEMPGRDVEHEIELTLEEALQGSRRTVVTSAGRRIEVAIPPGVREGSRVRVSGEGHKGRGHKGDLYLRVRLRPHERFTRQEDALLTTISVPLTTAVLGGEVDVATLDGHVTVKVPPGTPSGRVLRVRGQGFPRLDARNERGDLLVTISASLPEKLSARERELFEELRRLGR